MSTVITTGTPLKTFIIEYDGERKSALGVDGDYISERRLDYLSPRTDELYSMRMALSICTRRNKGT